MRRFTKERLDEMDDFQSIRNERLSKEEQAAIDQEVDLELAALKEMQEEISKQVAAWMSEQDIGIVKFTKLLNASTKQTNKIMNANANLTLASLAQLATLMHKKPRIVFEDT